MKIIYYCYCKLKFNLLLFLIFLQKFKFFNKSFILVFLNYILIVFKLRFYDWHLSIYLFENLAFNNKVYFPFTYFIEFNYLICPY